MKNKRLHKFLNRAVAFVTAAGLALLPPCGALTWTGSIETVLADDAPAGYHYAASSITYNIIKFDDLEIFSDYTTLHHASTNSRFGWPFCEWCSECNDEYGNPNHWVTQAANFYGYYDTVNNKYVFTGASVYGGERNKVDNHCAVHETCNDGHGKSHKSVLQEQDQSDIQDLNSWMFDGMVRYLSRKGAGMISLKTLKSNGCTFEYSRENGIGGTVTVTYNNQLVPNNYNIVFNPSNGGSAFSHAATYDSSNRNAGAASAAWNDCTLQGWYTGQNGTGEKVYDADGNAVSGSFWSGSGSSAVCRWDSTDGATLNLYAYWTGTVTVNAGTGISSVSGGGVKSVGSDVTITSTTKTGYTTPYWEQDVADSSKAYGNIYTFTMPGSSISFTAYASPKQYAITWNSNGGSSTPANTDVTYDSTQGNSVPSSVITKNGCRFDGWSDASGNMIYDSTGNAVNGTYWTGSGAQAVWKYAGGENPVKVYAKWADVTSPTVSAVPSQTTWITTSSVKITADDNDTLASDNAYRYYLSESSSSLVGGSWTSYANNRNVTIGSGLTGTYYLWVMRVKDTAGNWSCDSDYHVFGPYRFDNSSPDLSSIKNTYGWFEPGSTTEISFDISDNEAGLKSIVLKDVNDVLLADLTSGAHSYSFSASGVNFYNIIATDNLDNTSKKMFVVKIGTPAEIPAESAVWKGLNNLELYQSWLPITYTIRFDKNDGDSATKVTGTMADVPAIYDVPVNLPENKFARDGYEFIGWNTSADGNGKSYANRETVKNLTAVRGGKVTLYAQWKDSSAPQLSVTPTETVNPDVENDAVKSIDVTITIAEKGSGLSPDNHYEYGFSTSITTPPDNWFEYCSSPASDSFSTTLNRLGISETGFYYLWVKQIKDRYGNLSSSIGALATIASCHVYGVYAFDNTAPSGTVKYIENNATLGLYNDTLNVSPYAVMNIYDAYDDVSGISGFSLVISDVNNADNRAEFSFIENSGSYACRFSLYDCLKNFQDVERVNMSIHAFDRLGNTATLPITSYDFGTLQSGSAIHADDIGFLLADSSGYVYSRDAFRVEAYIENISHNSHGTSFTGGQKGRLRIYTFGNVHSVCADFGSVKKYINPAYDTHPDLEMTVIQPTHTAYIYLHDFFIPLGCASSTYTDTTALGFKKGGTQHRNVVYDVSGTLTDNIKTILKYNAR